MNTKKEYPDLVKIAISDVEKSLEFWRKKELIKQSEYELKNEEEG